MSAENGERVSFRKLLLNRCQEEFQKENVDTTLIEGMQREIDEATSDDVKKEKKELMEFTIAKNKRRSLGNIRLVALACMHVVSRIAIPLVVDTCWRTMQLVHCFLYTTPRLAHCSIAPCIQCVLVTAGMTSYAVSMCS